MKQRVVGANSCEQDGGYANSGGRFSQTMTAERQLVLQSLSGITQWAASQPEILAVAIVGSHTRNAAIAASDLDLVIIATEPDRYLKDSRWAQSFGTVDREQIENYGRLTSLRVWYSGQFRS